MKDKNFRLLIMVFLMVLVINIQQVLVNAEPSSTNDISWQTAMNTITNSSLFKNVVKGYSYSLIGFSPHFVHDSNWNWINQSNNSEMNFNLFNGTNFVETVQVILDPTLDKVVNVVEWHPNFDDYGKFGTKSKISPVFRQEFSMNFKNEYASMESDSLVSHLLEKYNVVMPNYETGLDFNDPISKPLWITKTVGWWANGEISDNEIVQEIQYLIDNNIIEDVTMPKNSGEIVKATTNPTIYQHGSPIYLTIRDINVGPIKEISTFRQDYAGDPTPCGNEYLSFDFLNGDYTNVKNYDELVAVKNNTLNVRFSTPPEFVSCIRSYNHIQHVSLDDDSYHAKITYPNGNLTEDLIFYYSIHDNYSKVTLQKQIPPDKILFYTENQTLPAGKYTIIAFTQSGEISKPLLIQITSTPQTNTPLSLGKTKNDIR